MKSKIVLALCVAVFAASLGITNAADLRFSMDRKKLSQKNFTEGGDKQGSQAMKVDVRDIVYTIIVESESLRDLENFTVEYNIYYEEAPPPQQGRGNPNEPKPQATPKTFAGKHTIEKLASRKKTEFDTGSITIKEVSSGGRGGSRGGGGGGSGQAKDRVVGSIIRAHDAEGKLLGEYINPANIASKFEWRKP